MLNILAVVGSLLFVVPVQTSAEIVEPPKIALEAGHVATVITHEPVVLTIEEKIVERATHYGYSTKRAVAIARSESHFKNICNWKYDGEAGMFTACGIFMFTRTTYKAFCGPPAERFDVDKNIDCAVRMLSEGGESHWEESKHGKHGWGQVPLI